MLVAIEKGRAQLGCSAKSFAKIFTGSTTLMLLFSAVVRAQQPSPKATAPGAPSGEANLQLPDLSGVKFLGIDGHTLLLFGLGFCILGLIFGLVSYQRLKNLPVHRAMREVSELIYETCKTYLITQGK